MLMPLINNEVLSLEIMGIHSSLSSLLLILGVGPLVEGI